MTARPISLHSSVPTQSWKAVRANGNGYVQNVNVAAILDLARAQQTIVRMERGIGEFVVHDTVLASLALAHPPEQDMIVALQQAYSLSRHRTLEQDVTFGIRQIVDIALRALSPGVNDTTTAVMCVDYLTAILAHLASRDIPSLYRYEGEDLRVLAVGPTFVSLVAESFDQIRGSGVGNVAILLRMLDALETIGSRTTSPIRRRVLSEHLQWITEVAQRTVESPHDRTRFESRLARVQGALQSDPS